MRKVLEVLIAVVVVLTFLMTTGATGAAKVQQVTITMRDFSYSPSRVTLVAGVPAEITLVNKGKVAHEFMVYTMPKSMGMMGGEQGHEWVEKTNYFHMVSVSVTGGKVRRHQGDFMELNVPAGKSATLRFTPQKKGTFEMGCMIENHYEAGQHGVLIVK